MRTAHFLRLVMLVLGLLASPAWADELRIQVAGGGALVLPVPEGWRNARQPGPLPTVSLTPANGDAFQVLVSPLVAPDGRLAPATPDAVLRTVEAAAAAAQSQAVEKTLPVQAFGSGNVRGNYFSATDRAPKPGEFKFMTQGAMSVQGLPVSFTILSNGNASAAVEPALRMLAAARRE